MRNAATPQCRWVTVDDGAGHRRLEMQWTRPGTVTTLSARNDRTAARAA